MQGKLYSGYLRLVHREIVVHTYARRLHGGWFDCVGWLHVWILRETFPRDDGATDFLAIALDENDDELWRWQV